MKAQALVLDFGGVISRTLFETHDITERALRLPAGTLTWRGPFDAGSDPLWEAMLRDEITERDYWGTRTREVGALIGENWDRMEQFVQRARGAEPALVIRPEADRAIRAVSRAGYRLAILSNELDLFYGAEFRARLPLLSKFDAIVDATHTGILKPDPRAYAAVAEALDLPVEACVFVDDQPRNISGAFAVGMECVLFHVQDPAGSFDRALSFFDLGPQEDG